MARPLQTGLDYFPLDTNIDDTIELLEAKFGLEGFAIFIKLLQKIYSNNYYLDWNEEIKLLFAKKNSLNIDSLNNVLNYCLEKNILNNTLFLKYSILTSSGIQSRYFKAIERRKNIKIINEYILVDLKRINAAMDLINVNINSLNVNINSQSKVDYSKEEQIKENINKSSSEEKNDDDDFLNSEFQENKFDNFINDWNTIFVENFKFKPIPLNQPHWLRDKIFEIKDLWDTEKILKAVYASSKFLKLKTEFQKFWHNPENIKKVLAGNFSDENFSKNYKPEDPRGKYINPADPENKLGNTWEKPYIGKEYVNNPNSIYYGKKKIIVG